PWILPSVLGVTTLLVWGIAVALSPNALVLHRLAATDPIGSILPASLAAALWLGGRRWRWAALAVTALALAPLVAATSAFVRTTVPDPLMASMPALSRQPVNLKKVASGPAPENAVNLRISPDGRSFVVALSNDDDEPSGTFVIGDVGGRTTSIEATDVEFLDESRVLVLSRDGGQASLTLRNVHSPDQRLSTRSLPSPASADLLVEAHSQKWSVIARSRAELVRIAGQVTGDPSTTKWTLPGSPRAYWLASDDEVPLGL